MTYRIERHFYDRIDTIETGLSKDQAERRVNALSKANRFFVYRAIPEIGLSLRPRNYPGPGILFQKKIVLLSFFRLTGSRTHATLCLSN